METGHSPFGSPLTREAFDELLRFFHPEPLEAGKAYLRLRDKLVSYFDFERCWSAEDLADEVLNRVARRLNEGQRIERIGAYSLGVARLVAAETRQKQIQRERKLREFARISATAPRGEKESALHCLDHCLAKLPPESNALLLTYYSGDRRARIDQRKRLMQELQTQPAALRNRVLRLRGTLEKCLRRCLRNPSPDGRSTL
ncbi:MAG TPA: hypothetical protein VMB85_15035 [Bryobacteraceae bacterium]|nr:hypothetical protein [Bryobacteraceae bacterium]